MKCTSFFVFKKLFISPCLNDNKKKDPTKEFLKFKKCNLLKPFPILLLDTRVRLLLNPFRLWFDSLFRVLFTFPSRYLFSIGFLIIFSLGSNSRPFFRQHYKADLLFQNVLSLRVFSLSSIQNRTFTLFGCTHESPTLFKGDPLCT